MSRFSGAFSRNHRYYPVNLLCSIHLFNFLTGPLEYIQELLILDPIDLLKAASTQEFLDSQS